VGSVKQVMRFPSDSRKGRAYLAQAVHKVLVCGVPRMVKNLKRIEKACFPVSWFPRTAGFWNLQSMYNPGSTIKS